MSDKKTHETDKEELPISIHLAELRSRLLIILIFLIPTLILLYPFSDNVMEIVWKHILNEDISLTIYSPLELIVVRITLSIVLSLLLLSPLLLYEFMAFVAPGLYEKEKKYLFIILPFSLFFMFFGTSFAYYIALPKIFEYSAFYSTELAAAQLSVKKVIYFVLSGIFIFGIIFQVPILIFISIKLEIIKYETLKKNRWVVYGIFLTVLMLSTPDPSAITQVIGAAILVVLFEISLIFARFL